jgi:ribose 1,5-bisphosphokinase PhnN
MTGRLFLIVGPSGAGKDTVIAGLAARLRRAFPARATTTIWTKRRRFSHGWRRVRRG